MFNIWLLTLATAKKLHEYPALITSEFLSKSRNYAGRDGIVELSWDVVSRGLMLQQTENRIIPENEIQQ